VEKINHTHSTIVGIGKKTSISAKGRVWLALCLLLLAALWGPVGQVTRAAAWPQGAVRLTSHPAYALFADGDGPKVGAGG